MLGRVKATICVAALATASASACGSPDSAANRGSAEPSSEAFADAAASEDGAESGIGSEDSPRTGEQGDDGGNAEGVGSGTAAEGSAAGGDALHAEPLTGLPTTDPHAEHRRALAVKIGNNSTRSRPQVGLASADLVFEILIEAFRTRFLAVYQSEIPARIGPVRSARTSDFDLLRDLGTPYFAASGGNTGVLRRLRTAAREDDFIDGSASSSGTYYERDRTRRSPYNLFFEYRGPDSDPDDRSDAADSGSPAPGGALALPLQPVFEYGDAAGASADESATGAGIVGAIGLSMVYKQPSGVSAAHIWDESSEGWVRIQDGSLHVTEAESGTVEIAPANVVVLSIDYERSAADAASPHAVSYGRGEAWLLTRGEVVETTWERSEDSVGFRLFRRGDGTAAALTPGKTWVLLANRSGPYPAARIDVISLHDGRALLAAARSAHAAS